jgi:hypothetical protein
MTETMLLRSKVVRLSNWGLGLSFSWIADFRWDFTLVIGLCLVLEQVTWL